jgi:anti-sigma factor RsiW
VECAEVKELLSAYYDGELFPRERTAVAEHLKGCHDCARELEGFHRVSALAEGSNCLEPPAQLWNRLEEQLDGEQCAESARTTWADAPRWIKTPAVRLVLATAAVILIAVGWLGYTKWFQHHDDHQFAETFGQYLDEFSVNPNAAQKLLLAKYHAQSVDPAEAIQTVGYRPAIADGMPDGYSIESTHVMTMPCCTCVQSLCRRNDGSTIAIFEHDDDEMDVWFGGRPEISTVCNGARCSLVELDDGFAASWRHGKRHVTVIGLRDTAEIGDLVAWMGDAIESNRSNL